MTPITTTAAVPATWSWRSLDQARLSIISRPLGGRPGLEGWPGSEVASVMEDLVQANTKLFAHAERRVRAGPPGAEAGRLARHPACPGWIMFRFGPLGH